MAEGEEQVIAGNQTAVGTAVPRGGGGSTARTVLRLLTLLAHAPNGMRADEVAKALGRSTSTAYNLLDTLCQERFVIHAENGSYRLTSDAANLVPAQSARGMPAGLAGVLDELFARTHKRVYLAAARSGQVVIPAVRGRQGMPLIPGLGARIGENAHALGLGKIALSLLDERGLDRYISHGLRSFTPATITSGERLRAELDDVRSHGLAYDREEFASDFCCMAAAVRNGSGRAVAALGISMTARCFELERDTLSLTLREVAEQAAEVLREPAIPAIPEDPAVLEQPARRTLGSGIQEAHMSST